MTSKSVSLFQESENYTQHGWCTVGIMDKEPPKGCSWTDKRGTVADVIYRQKYFCNNEDVKRLAILLDSIKFGFALDVDGAKAMHIFKGKIMPRYSKELQDKINRTTHTKTANSGYHWLFEIRRQDFPKGIQQKRYWVDRQNTHGEIKLIGTNQYVIERGIGYESIRGIESLVSLSEQETKEFLDVLDTYDRETRSIMKVSSVLSKYHIRSNRQNLVLRVAGYLHKHNIHEYLCCNLVEHLVESTNDYEPVKRFQAVRNTYVKEANTDQVSGRVKLLEAVDGNESVLDTINQEFGRLGYLFDKVNHDDNINNGNGNGSSAKPGRAQKPEEEGKKKRYEYIQKYSVSETVLAEAIIIGQKAFFALADFTNPDEVMITLQKQIELDDDRKTVLKPLDLISYINKPYRFKSEEEFWGYIEKAKQETTDSLYRKVKAIWKKYVDADNFHISICSADTIFTHKQDRVGTCHYLFFVGDNDSGKSAGLTILEYLAYRNMSSIGITYANIYQFLGSRDEGVGTICEDEADNIDQDTDKMRLYKSGYTKGKVVPKTDTSFGRTQYKFNAYCFKAFAAEKLPDPAVAKGFLQRIIELKCIPGFPDYDISEVVDPGDDEELQRLLDELIELRNIIFCHFRLLHYKDKIPNIKLNIRNREKQLFKPVLRIFHNTQTFNELLPVISRYVSQKREAKVDSYHAFLFRLIKDMIRSKKSPVLESKDIWEKFKDRVDWKPIPNKPQTIDTVEFGNKSQKELNQTLKDIFGAKPPRRHGNNREQVFDTDLLDKMGRNYDIEVEIKVREGREDKDDRNGTHGMLGTHLGLTQYLTQTACDKNNAENESEEDRNIAESNPNNEKSTRDLGVEKPTLPNNVSHVSQVSQTTKSSTNQYQPEGTNSETMCPNLTQSNTEEKAKTESYSDSLIDGIPIWQKENRGMTAEEAEAYKEEVARIGRSKNSKVADMAAANS